MKSLYFKIFLWFWLGFALVGSAFVISTESRRSEDRYERWRDWTSRRLIAYGEMGAEAWQRDGAEGLDRLLDRLEAYRRASMILLDSEMEALSPGSIDDVTREIVERALSSGEIEIEFTEQARVAAQPVSMEDGSRYILLEVVENQPRGDHDNPYSDHWIAATRGFAALLIAGIVCWALARYLTSPILRMGEAARSFSTGALDARVGEAAGRRGDELGELARDFDVMAERIESLVVNQRQLLSDISHELRSPLARLYVALELARARAGAEAGTALERIEREAERLSHLIGQTLTLSKLETGSAPIAIADVNLHELVGSVAEDADYEASAAGRTVALARVDECSLSGNENLLRSAVENIVRNALRHTEEGTTVEIELLVEGVAGEGSGRCARIRVRDHGPGVPDQEIANLFRPFQRLDEARDRETGGTGLGLAITQRAVNLHGGSVSAENAADGGLRVEIVLPLERADRGKA